MESDGSSSEPVSPKVDAANPPKKKAAKTGKLFFFKNWIISLLLWLNTFKATKNNRSIPSLII